MFQPYKMQDLGPETTFGGLEPETFGSVFWLEARKQNYKKWFNVPREDLFNYK